MKKAIIATFVSIGICISVFARQQAGTQVIPNRFNPTENDIVLLYLNNPNNADSETITVSLKLFYYTSLTPTSLGVMGTKANVIRVNLGSIVMGPQETHMIDIGGILRSTLPGDTLVYLQIAWDGNVDLPLSINGTSVMLDDVTGAQAGVTSVYIPSDSTK